MANCATVGANNVLQITADAVEQCQGVIVLSPADYQKFNSPFAVMTIDEANIILVAVIGMWAVAVTFRELIRFFNPEKGNDDV